MSDIDAVLKKMVEAEVARQLAAARPANDPPPALVTIASYARARSIAESTVRKAIREKRLPAVKIGRSVRIRPTDEIGLLRWLVRAYSKPGDLVADPTCGSGAVVHAARDEGRVGPHDDFPLMVATSGGYQMDEASVRGLHAQFGAWLDAPRLAARESAEVVAADPREALELVKTTAGEWGVLAIEAAFDDAGNVTTCPHCNRKHASPEEVAAARTGPYAGSRCYRVAADGYDPYCADLARDLRAKADAALLADAHCFPPGLIARVAAVLRAGGARHGVAADATGGGQTREDHLRHAIDHVYGAAMGDTSEPHLEHAIARLALAAGAS